MLMLNIVYDSLKNRGVDGGQRFLSDEKVKFESKVTATATACFSRCFQVQSWAPTPSAPQENETQSTTQRVFPTLSKTTREWPVNVSLFTGTN